MKIFFSVGEPSGDVHGANLIRELKRQNPDTQCVGFGGPLMREAGFEPLFDLTSLAVMWVFEVLIHIRKFYALADEAEAYFQTEKPDAVVLIDYPGFNWHIAKRAKRCGIPVFYYSPPQVWSWRQSRVQKMRQNTDLIFSGLPFEAQWLREHGCCVEYVGHPFFDEVQRQPRNTDFMRKIASHGPLVALLPGSRTKEVERNFPVFWNAALKIHEKKNNVHFCVAAFRETHAEWIRNFIAQKTENLSTPPSLSIFTGHTAEIIQASRCCVSVSGSVSLELLNYTRPTVISYRVSRFGWWTQWVFRCVKYITLVNLLSVSNPFQRFNREFRPNTPEYSEVLFPEYLTYSDRSGWIADDILNWLENDDAYQTTLKRLETLRSEIALPGAAQRASEEIFRFLDATQAEDET